MLYITPIILYVLIIVGLVAGANHVSKNKEVKERKRMRSWVIISSTILFPILGFLYLSFLFGIAIDDHYDLEKGTFLWYAVMDNETITEFPVVELYGNVTYNGIGGNYPGIAKGWEIKYISKTNCQNLIPILIEYLRQAGYTINEVRETQYDSTKQDKKNRIRRVYSGSNIDREILNLVFQEQDNGMTEIECRILL